MTRLQALQCEARRLRARALDQLDDAAYQAWLADLLTFAGLDAARLLRGELIRREREEGAS